MARPAVGGLSEAARAHHSQTSGRLERWHRTMEEVVSLVVHRSPDQVREAIGRFVDYYERDGYQEAFRNAMPEAVYLGRREMLLQHRKEVRMRTSLGRRMHYYFS